MSKTLLNDYQKAVLGQLNIPIWQSLESFEAQNAKSNTHSANTAAGNPLSASQPPQLSSHNLQQSPTSTPTASRRDTFAAMRASAAITPAKKSEAASPKTATSPAPVSPAPVSKGTVSKETAVNTSPSSATDDAAENTRLSKAKEALAAAAPEAPAKQSLQGQIVIEAALRQQLPGWFIADLLLALGKSEGDIVELSSWQALKGYQQDFVLLLHTGQAPLDEQGKHRSITITGSQYRQALLKQRLWQVVQQGQSASGHTSGAKHG